MRTIVLIIYCNHIHNKESVGLSLESPSSDFKINVSAFIGCLQQQDEEGDFPCRLRGFARCFDVEPEPCLGKQEVVD